MRSFTVYLICVGVLCLSGCGTPIISNVDAIAAPNASSFRSYVILSGKKDVSPTDLNFREYASVVDSALQAKGFAKARSIDTADVAIFLNYDVSDPQTTPYVLSMPMYGEIGGGTTYQSGSIYSGGQIATYSGTTYQPSRYGVVGTSTYAGYITTYYRLLRLDAVDVARFKQTQQLEPVWKATAVSGGQSSDLRAVFPYLVVSCMDYIGTNTGKTITVKLVEGDKRAKVLMSPAARQHVP